jgi:dipeptidyl aminopeptidase/acylaminoacyl peptidase
MNKTILKFGCWPSKVSAEFVAGKALRFQTVQALGDSLYWTEQRPLEKGRAALMCARPNAPSPDNDPRELLAAPWSASTKVHEYGGNAFLATADTLFFVNGADQQIWSLENPPTTDPAPTPHQITDTPEMRFADLIFDEQFNRLICVGERKGKNGNHPENLLVAINLEGGGDQSISPLIEGEDFYASPRLSGDGQQLAYVSWNLPAMPWEGATLQIAQLDKDGRVTKTSSPNEQHNGASFQPEWDENGDLWFINDDTDFGQLYRFDGKGLTLYPQEGAETGLPLWVFGMKTYGFLQKGRIASISLAKGEASLSTIDQADKNVAVICGTGAPDTQNAGLCSVDQLVTLRDKATGKDSIAGIISRFDKPDAIATINIQTGEISTVKSSAEFDLPANETSIAKTLMFENELGQTVYGNYYPPTNSAFAGPQDELPPVILTAHGGPTAFSHCGLKPKTQFWTSRGFGYFDVNYSGSWGFGKAYRERLDQQWGLRDVADMAAAAQSLIDARLADPARLLISGSSAGGYTVLMALVSSNLFAAGASYYGISDLARLYESTHKFEAGYIERLLGLTAENKEAVLKDRSPLFRADQISSPVIFFQGLQDKVVPPDQAELMVEALKKNDIETRYKTFEKEGHGFRNSQTIETALSMEYQFYKDLLAL